MAVECGEAQGEVKAEKNTQNTTRYQNVEIKVKKIIAMLLNLD